MLSKYCNICWHSRLTMVSYVAAIIQIVGFLNLCSHILFLWYKIHFITNTAKLICTVHKGPQHFRKNKAQSYAHRMLNKMLLSYQSWDFLYTGRKYKHRYDYIILFQFCFYWSLAKLMQSATKVPSNKYLETLNK